MRKGRDKKAGGRTAHPLLKKAHEKQQKISPRRRNFSSVGAVRGEELQKKTVFRKKRGCRGGVGAARIFDTLEGRGVG